MSDTSTTKINIDISQLKKNIQEANRLIKVANSEFKATAATMGDWANNADGVSAKLSQLEKVLKSQNTVLDSLEQQYKAVAEEQGENSKGAQDLLIKINNQKAAIANTNNAIKKWQDALEGLNSEQKETMSASDKLKDSISEQESELESLKKKYADLVLSQGKSSDEAKETAKSISELSTKLKQSKSSLSDAESAADKLDQSLDDVDDSAKSAGDGFTVFKGVVADLVSSGIKSLIGGFVNLASETREYREDIAKLNTAFEDAGHTTREATDTYKELYSVFGEEDRAVEAAQQIAKLADSEEEMAEMTNIATGAWAMWGDSLATESLMEAANSTAKIGEVQGTLADALEWCGVNLDDFNGKLSGMATEEERSAYIMETLNGLYGEAAEKYRENNAEIIAANKAQSDLTDAYAGFGEMAEPIITAVKQGLADMLTACLDLVDGADFSTLTENISNGFSYLIDNVLPAIVDGFQWVLDNKDAIIAGIVGIGAGFVAWNVVTMIQGVVGAIKAFKLANEGATVAQLALNLAMKANVIGIIVTALAGLVAAFITLWNTSDEFREFWLDLWEKVKDATKKAWEKIEEWFSSAWDFVSETWGEAKEFFSNLWDSIKDTFSVVEDVLGDFFKSAWDAIKSYWDAVSGYFENVWNTIKNIFSVVKSVLSGNFSDAWDAIKNIVNGWKDYFSDIWSKVKNVFSPVATWFGDKFGDAWTKIKNKFSSWGEFWSGLWTKIKNKFKDIGSNIGSAISDSIKSGLNRVLSVIENTINKGIRLINSAINLANKLPGVSVSTISEISLPRLYRGGVLKKGQVGLLEGSGAEAVVPLERNKLWIQKTAKDMTVELQKQGVLSAQAAEQGKRVYQTFNQYNTSPKALSRLEIYRMTRNQLSFAKGV